MTDNLELRPEVEEQLEAHAKQAGLSAEDYLKEKVEEMISASELRPAKTPEERVRLWQEFLDSHAHITAPPLSDYAVSRESIYTRDDEML